MNETTDKHFLLITHYDIVKTNLKIKKLQKKSGQKREKYRIKLLKELKNRIKEAINKKNIFYIERMIRFIISYENILFTTDLNDDNFHQNNPSVFFDEILRDCLDYFDDIKPALNSLVKTNSSVFFDISYSRLLYNNLIMSANVKEFVRIFDNHEKIIFKIIYMLLFCYDNIIQSGESEHLKIIIEIYFSIKFEETSPKKLPSDYKKIEEIFKKIDGGSAKWVLDQVKSYMEEQYRKHFDFSFIKNELQDDVKEAHEYINLKIKQDKEITMENINLYSISSLLDMICK